MPACQTAIQMQPCSHVRCSRGLCGKSKPFCNPLAPLYLLVPPCSPCWQGVGNSHAEAIDPGMWLCMKGVLRLFCHDGMREFGTRLAIQQTSASPSLARSVTACTLLPFVLLVCAAASRHMLAHKGRAGCHNALSAHLPSRTKTQRNARNAPTTPAVAAAAIAAAIKQQSSSNQVAGAWCCTMSTATPLGSSTTK